MTSKRYIEISEASDLPEQATPTPRPLPPKPKELIKKAVWILTDSIDRDVLDYQYAISRVMTTNEDVAVVLTEAEGMTLEGVATELLKANPNLRRRFGLKYENKRLGESVIPPVITEPLPIDEATIENYERMSKPVETPPARIPGFAEAQRRRRLTPPPTPFVEAPPEQEQPTAARMTATAPVKPNPFSASRVTSESVKEAVKKQKRLPRRQDTFNEFVNSNTPSSQRLSIYAEKYLEHAPEGTTREELNKYLHARGVVDKALHSTLGFTKINKYMNDFIKQKAQGTDPLFTAMDNLPKEPTMKFGNLGSRKFVVPDAGQVGLFTQVLGKDRQFVDELYGSHERERIDKEGQEQAEKSAIAKSVTAAQQRGRDNLAKKEKYRTQQEALGKTVGSYTKKGQKKPEPVVKSAAEQEKDTEDNINTRFGITESDSKLQRLIKILHSSRLDPFDLSMVYAPYIKKLTGKKINDNLLNNLNQAAAFPDLPVDNFINDTQKISGVTIRKAIEQGQPRPSKGVSAMIDKFSAPTTAPRLEPEPQKEKIKSRNKRDSEN